MSEVDCLFVRIDRIGDLVLTLPVSHHSQLKHLKKAWVIPAGLDFVLEHAQPKPNWYPLPKKSSLQMAWAFWKLLKQLQPKIVVVFYGPWWVGGIASLLSVPLRIGRASQWHSYLFFNRRLRQSRSKSEKHELEYNFELLEHGLKLQSHLRSSSLSPKDLTRHLILEAPAEIHLFTTFKLAKKKYFVVHPGMGGSAANWSTDNYEKAIRELAKKMKVVITGTFVDKEVLEPLRAKLSEMPEVQFLDQLLNGAELLQILSSAAVVLAPSTGVLHLAASLGTPVVGIYSAILQERSLRWGPLGEKTAVVEREGTVGGDSRISEITVEEVLRAMDQIQLPEGPK